MIAWLTAAVLIVGLLLLLGGRGLRRRRGLTDATTLDLDSRTLYSARYGLAGRPDRIVTGGIPKEWKSARRVYDSHIAQLGCYFILIEEETGVRPPHGFIVTGDGACTRVENSPELRSRVLEIADQIREARRRLAEPILVSQPPAKCRLCGMRGACEQRSG